MYVDNNAVKCERKYKTKLTEHIWPAGGGLIH